MKRLTLALCAATFLLFSCNNKADESKGNSDSSSTTTTTTSNDKVAANPCEGYKPDTANKAMPMDSAMMKSWMDYMTPGPMHAMLAKSNGEWEADITSWMSADAPPSKSKGTATNSMILEGRYQVSEHTGCFDGMPFYGKNTLGYDNIRKVFISSWVDNMGTGIMIMEGKWDEATKTMRLKGDCTNPMTGKMATMREEFTIIDDNTQKMTMYAPDMMTGKEYKNMEILLTRKK